MVHIYALSDPRTPNVYRYVGKTSRSLSKRLSRHVFEARSEGHTHKQRWILSLLQSGVRPIIALLESCEGDSWKEAEKNYIAKYRSTLTNATEGGDGCQGLSEEARARISVALKGREISPEWREKLAAANRGKHLSLEHRKKLSDSQAGRTKTSQMRERLAAAKTGTKLSPETKAKISAAKRARDAERLDNEDV